MTKNWNQMFICLLLATAVLCSVTVSIFYFLVQVRIYPFDFICKIFNKNYFNFQKPYESYEEQLISLQEQNVIDRSVNISSFYKWRGRQSRQESDEDDEESRNPFIQWLQYILGITTTTPTAPLTPPTECSECSCGKSNNNRIVGGTETGIK